MTGSEIEQIKKLIIQSKKILILTHINPDGDGIGSGLALMNYLTKQKKKVFFINRDPLPKIYKFLPGSSKVKNSEKINDDFDLAIILECPELERTGNIIDFKKQVKYTINIDHHIGNTMYADLNVVDPKAAAVGIQIYKMMKGFGCHIDRDIATCIYTSIIIDTGSFRYSNTTPEVHLITAELIKAGADPEYIASEVYATTKNSTDLFGKMLSRLKIVKNVGWSVITLNMLRKSGADESDTDNFINSIRSIKEVEIAVLFKEYGKNKTKASLRSKNGYDVNKIARIFGGGGHKHAAGCLIDLPLKKTENKIISEIFKYYKNKIK